MFNYLFSVQNCPAPDYVHNIRNNIDIKFPSNGFNPYIIVADDVSSLGFLTLLTPHNFSQFVSSALKRPNLNSKKCYTSINLIKAVLKHTQPHTGA